MIASLRGRVQHKALDHLVIDVQGVGYQVSVSSQTLASLPYDADEVFLLCHTHVREDALQIFGFAEAAEREAFNLLMGVSGVGPKLALTVLSGLPVAQLALAIRDGDHRRLQSIPGVGKRTAERLVVDLKDRVGGLTSTNSGGAARPSGGADANVEDVAEALANLGYKRSVAERAVASVIESSGDEPIAAEQLLRLALVAIAEL